MTEVQEVKDETEKEFRNVIQPPTKFSDSILWDWMREFYAKSGVEAWSKGVVPFFITCNAYIAKCYAQSINAYVNDLVASGNLDRSEPIHIVELGTGAGKFSFLLLKALEERHELQFGSEMSQSEPFRFKYIMTDFSSSPFEFWEKHPAFQRYFSKGYLDYATFDAVQDTSVTLQRGKYTISSGTLKNPVIVVANYLFDSLPANSFQLRNGKWFQGLPAILTESPEKDNSDPDLLNRFQARFYWDEVDSNLSEQFVQEELELNKSLCSLLGWYKIHFQNQGVQDASVLVPTVSLRCLQRISKWPMKGGMMVMSGDKGSSNTGSCFGLYDPHIAVHGSFSLMVNYHFLGMWFELQRGFALHTPNEEVSLKVSAFVIPAHSQSLEDEGSLDHCDFQGTPKLDRVETYRNLLIAFQDSVLSFGPDHFFYLQKSCDERVLLQSDLRQTSESILKSLASLLQLSDWDADLFFKYRETILDHIAQVGPRLEVDILHGVSRVWKNYYVLEHDKDVAFELGRLCYGLHRLEKALLFYSKSCEQMGPHHVTEHNIGLCHYHLNNMKESKKAFGRAIALNASYSKARMWLSKLDNNSEVLPVDKSNVTLPVRKALQGSHQVSIDPEILARST